MEEEDKEEERGESGEGIEGKRARSNKGGSGCYRAKVIGVSKTQRGMSCVVVAVSGPR